MNNAIDTIRKNTIQRTGDRVKQRVDKYVRDTVATELVYVHTGNIKREIDWEIKYA